MRRPFTLLLSLAVAAGLHASALAEEPQFKRSLSALAAGNSALAIELLTAELQKPGMTPDQLAHAFYYRAKAYLAAQKLANATADAGAALWLNKLSESERAEAESIRSKGLAAVGITAQRPAALAAAAPAAEMKPETAPLPKQPAIEGRERPKKPPQMLAGDPAWPALTTPAPPQAVPAVPAQPQQPPPSWSTAEVQQEPLPVLNLPLPTPAAQPPVAQQVPATPPVAAAVVTPTPPPAPATAPTATIAGVTELPAKAASGVTSAIAGLVPSVLGTFETLYAPTPSPVQAEIERANEMQRAYVERIRAHNQARAASPPDAPPAQ